MPGRLVTRLKSCKWELMKFYTKADAVEIKKKKKGNIKAIIFCQRKIISKRIVFQEKKNTEKNVMWPF